MKKYKFQFDLWGLGLFLFIMIPNLIWFAVPTQNDVLRNPSVTERLDIVAFVFQVVMIAAICLVRNRICTARSVRSPWLWGMFFFIACYFAMWILYYCGMTSAFVIFGLCIFPCIVFLLYELDRKNYIALLPTLIFTCCHVIFGLENFIF